MTTLVQDTYIRANQSGWGTASDGINVWASPTQGTTSISSNEGLFVGFGGGADCQDVCGSHTPTDINMLIRTKTTNAGGDLNGLLWRWTTATSNGYRCGFFGGTTFNVDKYVSGSRSNITSGSVSGGYNSGDFWWIRLIHTSGGTLSIRWWKDGTSEPSNFTGFISITETTYSSGNFGVSVFAASVDTVTFDSLTVTDNHNVTTNTRTITPVTAALKTTSTRTVPASAALKTTNTRTVSDTAALKTTNTRTVSDTAALKTTNTRTVTPVSAALKTTTTRIVSTSAALKTSPTRSVPDSAALKTTNTRSAATQAALKTTSTRTVPTSATLAKTRSVLCTACLTTNFIFEPNAMLLVPSGQTTLLVPSGQTNLIVPSGQTTLII